MASDEQVLSFDGWLWRCVNCQTVAMSYREELRNYCICALIAQMQMAMPRG